jgi:hypothetical protein
MISPRSLWAACKYLQKVAKGLQKSAKVCKSLQKVCKKLQKSAKVCKKLQKSAKVSMENFASPILSNQILPYLILPYPILPYPHLIIAYPGLSDPSRSPRGAVPSRPA